MITSKLAEKIAEVIEGLIVSHLEVVQAEVDESDGNVARFSVSVSIYGPDKEVKVRASFARAPVTQSITIGIDDPNQTMFQLDEEDLAGQGKDDDDDLPADDGDDDPVDDKEEVPFE
jgi:hypothetical protein